MSLLILDYCLVFSDMSTPSDMLQCSGVYGLFVKLDLTVEYSAIQSAASESISPVARAELMINGVTKKHLKVSDIN